MASERSRDYDDDDRPRRKRRDDDEDDRPRRRRRDEDEDEEDDRPRRRRGETGKSNTGVIVAIVLGVVLVIGGIVAAVVAGRKSGDSDDTQAGTGTGPTNTAPFGGGRPGGGRPGGGTPAGVDAEGLPTGNDLDSVLVRLNRRYQQNDFFRYQLELENLRLLKSQASARRGEVFRALRGHAGTPATQPQGGTIPFAAWQTMLDWVSKDDVPELSRMLLTERIEARQSDVFRKLGEYKDPRCAEAVAPFLASERRRNEAEQLLKELDSSAEKFVLPYLAAGNAKETRVAALQVVSAVGTKESAKIV